MKILLAIALWLFFLWVVVNSIKLVNKEKR